MLRGWLIAAGLLVASAAVAAAEPIMIEIESARANFDQRTSEPVVAFKMTAASQQLFADFTSKNVGRKAEIRVDGRALMAPVIREPILGGSGQIVAGFKLEEAKELADRLSSGRARMEVEAVD
jgi:preprotein translocase subunit SecD